jgi:hypothetical protein
MAHTARSAWKAASAVSREITIASRNYKHRLRNNVVEPLVEEHDESGDDAGQPDTSGTHRMRSPARARTDADDSSKRPERAPM